MPPEDFPCVVCAAQPHDDSEYRDLWHPSIFSCDIYLFAGPKCSQETLGIGTGCPDCGGTRETLGTIEPDSEQGDSNEEFTECPNCSNAEPRTAILECDVCGLKHCDECSESVGFLGLGAKCPTPDCAGTRDTIGHIAEAKESESENSDEE